MRTKTVTVNHAGWFLFCPVWFEECPHETEAPCPIPRWGLWWLFEAAIKVQDGINWCLARMGHEDACGYVFTSRPMRHPRKVSFEVEYEEP